MIYGDLNERQSYSLGSCNYYFNNYLVVGAVVRLISLGCSDYDFVNVKVLILWITYVYVFENISICDSGLQDE